MNLETYMSNEMGAMEIIPFKNINTIDEFKEYIQGADFYANTEAIGILEFYLNIKTVIFELFIVYIPPFALVWDSWEMPNNSSVAFTARGLNPFSVSLGRMINSMPL